jgi:tRNA (adenine-N(1)-)-methyltransferase non-catalytic subunit
MRPDTFAQLMSISNVHPGARVLVVDDVSGLIVAGVLEHLGGMPTVSQQPCPRD